jgi:hypothetical protein
LGGRPFVVVSSGCGDDLGAVLHGQARGVAEDVAADHGRSLELTAVEGGGHDVTVWGTKRDAEKDGGLWSAVGGATAGLRTRREPWHGARSSSERRWRGAKGHGHVIQTSGLRARRGSGGGPDINSVDLLS